ncbi:MAG TPA: hypothetical protein VM711_08835 [Sphingomicrobium sp.]|nr:hypothetical protein [Sphingomicrobium sp.]
MGILVAIAVVDVLLLCLIVFSARRRPSRTKILDVERTGDRPHAL